MEVVYGYVPEKHASNNKVINGSGRTDTGKTGKLATTKADPYFKREIFNYFVAKVSNIFMLRW